MSFQNCSEVLVEKLIIQHQKYCNSSVLHHLNREEVIQKGQLFYQMEEIHELKLSLRAGLWVRYHTLISSARLFSFRAADSWLSGKITKPRPPLLSRV